MGALQISRLFHFSSRPCSQCARKNLVSCRHLAWSNIVRTLWLRSQPPSSCEKLGAFPCNQTLPTFAIYEFRNPGSIDHCAFRGANLVRRCRWLVAPRIGLLPLTLPHAISGMGVP